MKKKIKNWSHRYDIGPDMDKNIMNIKNISLMMLTWIKQHLSNIWSSIQEKFKQHRAWVEKKGCL